MKQYLLSIYQPGDGSPPPPEVLEPIMRRIHALHEAMKSAGALVYTGGFHPPGTATVLVANGNDVLLTDGLLEFIHRASRLLGSNGTRLSTS